MSLAANYTRNTDQYVLELEAKVSRMEQDITARQQSEEIFHKAFYDNQAIMAIVTLDETKFIEINTAALKIFGYSKEEVIGYTLLDQRFWADLKDREVLWEHLAKHGFKDNYECTLKSRSGQEITLLCSANLILLDNRKCLLVSGSDVTALRKYQKELMRLDNLNLIGQMAASIAHEVRNPMTSIKGFLQLFKSQFKYQEDQASMELMIEELDRVNDIISTFLSLAQKNQIDMRSHSLNDCIKNILPIIIADALKNDVYLETDWGDLSRVMIDEGEFRQLLLNLARNSIEAMADGGTLAIKTFADKDGVNLVIQDNGSGIPPEMVNKIGTPFFTTKPNGSGLGLGVCYSIAERHKARITFDTSNNGTCFKITFPAMV